MGVWTRDKCLVSIGQSFLCVKDSIGHDTLLLAETRGSFNLLTRIDREPGK
jgi:hypothetical protein